MITTATQTARNRVTELLFGLSAQTTYLALHSGEPVTNDPSATQIRMTGPVTVPIQWTLNGAEAFNANTVSFKGILPGQVATHLVVSDDVTGTNIMFYGEIPVYGSSEKLWDFYDLQAGSIRISVI
jgi:hypothetical protein